MKKIEKTINHKNRGMFLENLINKSIIFYEKNNIALFHKKEIPLKILEINDKRNVRALIFSKSTVDYYGIFRSQFICFEAKSTEDDYLSFSNIKNHQHKYLEKIEEFGGFSFYLIFFKKYEKFFFIKSSKLKYFENKKMTFQEISKKGIELSIDYPGILDFIKCIN